MNPRRTKPLRPRRGFRALTYGYSLLIYLFLYAPILVLVIFSFNESKSRSEFTGFSLQWYARMFSDQEILRSLYYTMLVATLSTCVSVALGIAASLGMHYMRKAPRAVFFNINYLPVLNPDIVTGISLMMLFSLIRLPLGLVTMLIAHIAFSTPYVILSILPKLRQMDPHTAEAALDLGAKPMYALRKVILPEIMPGVITGALIAFTMSIDDFVISFFTTGNGVSNLSIAIYSMAKRGVKPEINALSTLMFVTVMVLLAITNLRTLRNGKPVKIRKELQP